MDNQADQPADSGADPSDGNQQPGGDQPGGATPSSQPGGATPPRQPPGATEPGTRTPQPGPSQPWGSPQPGSDQPWGGTPQPGPGQPWGGPQPGGQPRGGMPQYGSQQHGSQQHGSPPPVVAGTRTGRPRVRPGRIWYLAAVLLFLGGVAWLVFGFVSLSSKVDAFERVPLPAGGTVTLNHSGGYVVYYEGPGANSGQIPSFRVQIAPTAPPAAVRRLRSYTASVTYTIGVHQGRAVLTLQVVHPGKFLVIPSAAGAAAGSDLAFGSSVAGGIVRTVLISIGLIFLGIIVAIVLFIIRLTRTRRARAQGF